VGVSVGVTVGVGVGVGDGLNIKNGCITLILLLSYTWSRYHKCITTYT